MPTRNLFRFISVRPPIAAGDDDACRLINEQAGADFVEVVAARQREHNESLPVARRAVSAAVIDSADYFTRSSTWADLRPLRERFQDLIDRRAGGWTTATPRRRRARPRRCSMRTSAAGSPRRGPAGRGEEHPVAQLLRQRPGPGGAPQRSPGDARLDPDPGRPRTAAPTTGCREMALRRGGLCLRGAAESSADEYAAWLLFSRHAVPGSRIGRARGSARGGGSPTSRHPSSGSSRLRRDLDAVYRHKVNALRLERAPRARPWGRRMSSAGRASLSVDARLRNWPPGASATSGAA